MQNEFDACLLKFGGLVDILYEHKRLSLNDAEDAKSQYEEFMSNVVRPNGDEFAKFDFASHRVDKFLSNYLAASEKYAMLWKVYIFVFVLSHGQASIERGFNVNGEVLVENLGEESLVSQRLVYDQLKSRRRKFTRSRFHVSSYYHAKVHVRNTN